MVDLYFFLLEGNGESKVGDEKTLNQSCLVRA